MPTAESEPTTEPVDEREVSWIFAARGVTIDRTAAGAKNPIVARPTVVMAEVPLNEGPITYTAEGESTASTPPNASTGPSAFTGSERSANRPPSHAPSAIAASTVPMIPVNDCSVTPT